MAKPGFEGARVIEFANVSKSFGRTLVLDELTFTARNGSVTGLVGANGAGKSTAFKILLGLVGGATGEALVAGRPYRESPFPGRALGAYISPQWIPGAMTGAGYLRYVAGLKGTDDQRVLQQLAMVGLTEAATQTVSGYSMGMRQRLGIAAAFLGDPENIVLDEPVNGLDIEGVHWLRGYLRSVANSGRCVLLSSHLLSELELVADDIVMLNGGRVVRSGTTDELRQTADAVEVRSADNGRLAALLSEHGVAARVDGSAIMVGGATVNDIARIAGSLDVPLLSVAKRTSRLEDVYLDEVRTVGTSEVDRA